MTITANDLKKALAYDEETGVFTWKIKSSRSVKVGSVAGTTGNGYVSIFLNGFGYYAHRLAWLYKTGSFPKAQLDHINGNRRDNRIANLRECSGSENQQNRTHNKNNSIGLVGVSWHKKSRKWQSQIGLNGRTKCLGMFDDPFDAHKAYLAAKNSLHTFQRTPQNKAS